MIKVKKLENIERLIADRLFFISDKVIEIFGIFNKKIKKGKNLK